MSSADRRIKRNRPHLFSRIKQDTRLLVSGRFARHLEITRPKTLYHYTSQSGILGVFSGSTIWATGVQYLNDTSEYKLGIDVAQNVISGLMGDAEHKRLRPTLTRMSRVLSEIERPNLFVTCFCEYGDLLSQWRGYAEATCGYSLGFSSDALERLAEAKGYTLGKCIYDPEVQREIVEDAVRGMMLMAGQIIDSGSTEALEEVPDSFAEMLLSCSAFFKRKAFEQEQEWRLVSGIVGNEKILFRPGKSMLIPFHRFDFGTGELSRALNRIIVGPCPNPGPAIEVVRLLVLGNDRGSRKKECEVRQSEIPFRNW